MILHCILTSKTQNTLTTDENIGLVCHCDITICFQLLSPVNIEIRLCEKYRPHIGTIQNRINFKKLY
jgi:hypothetical protein